MKGIRLLFIIPYLYKVQRVSGETPPIIRSLKLHWLPLVFHTWKVAGSAVCLTTSTKLHVQQPSTSEKPEDASAVLGS
jgi:hypothetical protein